MSRGFGTLIYTDCRPGQGLRGDTGLQFQARSADVGPSEMNVVQRTLLYEVPADWANQHRPRDKYPPSLAHAWDPVSGALGTAQGTYLGREANGLREGNQLTHAVITKDPDSYGLVRPAQLLHAPFWTQEPAATTECPQLADGWQPGPAEPETVRDFVTAHKDGRALLVTLLSALLRLGEPHPSRVLFIAERPEEVLQWIAAATLLLPQRQALTVGFKVFTTNPSYCSQPVLAVHPDWAGPYRSAGTSAGFVVLDLVSRHFTDIPPDELAERWVDLFMEADLYDVMDAVELAGVIAEAGAAPRQAAAAACSVALGRLARRGDVGPAADWVADGPVGLVSDHGEAVVDTLLGQASGRELRRLDGAAADGRVPGAANAIRVALLRDEIGSALSGTRLPAERLPSPGGQARAGTIRSEASRKDERPTSTDLIMQALRSAPDESVNALLRVAWRHRLTVSASFTDRATAFASWWADRPELDYDPECWPNGDIMTGLLRRELSRRLSSSAQRAEAAGAVRRTWWRLLLDTAVDLSQTLDSLVMAGAMDSGAPATCQALVRRVMAGAATASNSSAVSRACDVLWCNRAPETAEAMIVLEAVPAGVPVPAVLTDAIARGLAAGWSHGNMTSALDATRSLRVRRVTIPPEWRARHEADLLLDDLCARIARSAEPERKVMKALHALDRAVVAARAQQVAAALSRVADRDAIAAALADLPSDVGKALIGILARNYGTHPVETIRGEFMLLRAKRLPPPLRRRLENELRHQLAQGGSQLTESAGRALAREGRTARADWNEWLPAPGQRRERRS